MASSVIEPSLAVKRSEPWHDDGTIVLEAEQTQFRVHRSVLRAMSPIFADMFQVCEPSDLGTSEPLVEGCPVIQMHDSSEDWHYVLTALYDRGYHADFRRHAVQAFDVVAAFLRLGKKYAIEGLRAEAISRLRAEFPTTLYEFDQARLFPHHRGGRHIDFFSGDDRQEVDVYKVPQLADFIKVVNLARQTQTLSLLPAAFYVCCNDEHFVRDVIRNYTADEGGPASQLSPDDRNICISGRTEMIEKQTACNFPCLERMTVSDQRCDQPECDYGKMFIAVRMSASRLVALGRIGGLATRLCGHCKAEVETEHQEGCLKMWDELPSFFNLPKWEELLKMDE